MKAYFIIYRTLLICSYEKSNKVLILADCENSAFREAMLSECHGSLEDDTASWLSDDFSTIADMNGEMIYWVTGCEEVSEKDAKTLKRFMSFIEADSITDIIKYTDLIPLLSGGYSVGIEGDSKENLKPALYDTKEEAQKEIDDCCTEYIAQIKAGDRENDDIYEGILSKVFWNGEDLILLDDNNNHVEKILWRAQL